MPLNKLDNFIKNTEGRILYVSPSDLDATDAITNQGNSLARPFKTLQRALLESARFSYVAGNDNDLTEKTTILLMPGEHLIDNRPGYAVEPNAPNVKYKPYGATQADDSISDLLLDLNSNFDITQADNILFKFNSTTGGVIVPRGTSIIGLDLRKTKLRPKYVPNPTDNTPTTSIFKITGSCYFWQFSIFDGDEKDDGLVYTDPTSSTSGLVTPTFSHHKLTCFEYADGVNVISDGLTDLDMYYVKLNRAYTSSTRTIGETNSDRYPTNERDFVKQRPEWEIVGAFGKDPIKISNIIAGDGGGNPTNRITVTTEIDHNLTEGTPIKVSGVSDSEYNISTKVVIDPTDDKRTFHYLLNKSLADEINPSPGSGGSIVIETDTVSGASPYIFNISLRSVWGMNGMHADGSKASGFKSMVVAQFTGVSLQKDDRAFVKYNNTSRTYSLPENSQSVSGDNIAKYSSSTKQDKVWHLDSGAIYRNGWETTHIKASNDAILQIVSVFAIGYNKHFHTDTGSDASITNSNSNFGQLSLVSSSFKKEAFTKDNNAFITHIIPPRSIEVKEENIDWLRIDFDNTNNTGSKLYLFGFNEEKFKPSAIIQGYRIGARANDKLYVEIDSSIRSANITMGGSDKSTKEYTVSDIPTSTNGSKFTIGANNLTTGESVIIISDDGDYPENIIEHETYYVIVDSGDNTKIQLASSEADALNGEAINAYLGSNLKIISRVSDKNPGDIGHPVQYDDNGWYVNVESGTSNTIWDSGAIYNNKTGKSEPTFIKRIADGRSLDEKIYKLRVVIPKEFTNARNPENGYIIQESSSTTLRNANDADTNFNTAFSGGLQKSDYGYEKNHKLITNCSYSSSGTVTVTSELPHNLNTGDRIVIKDVKSANNSSGLDNLGFNGGLNVDRKFVVGTIINELEFEYSLETGTLAAPGAFSAPTPSDRNQTYPSFQKNDNTKNIYLYRNELIQEYVSGERDGIYHVYGLSADYSVTGFSNLKYGQNVVDLYPQHDRDNIESNPSASKSKATPSPLGKVVTNDVKKSITRETIDKLNISFGIGKKVSSVSAVSSGACTVTFDRNHNFNSLKSITKSTNGSGHGSDGDHYGIKLLGTGTNNTANEWKGATAKITVSSGAVQDIEIINGGSNYVAGEVLKLETGTATFNALTSADISSSIGNVIQFTGSGTITDSYRKIVSIGSSTAISVAQTSGDPNITSDQYGFIVGPSIDCDITSSAGVSTISATSNNTPIGLTVGNKFRLLDDLNNNLGDFTVSGTTGIGTITINSGISTSTGHILKHGMSTNDGLSDSTDENLEKRSLTLFDGVYGNLNIAINATEDEIEVTTNDVADEYAFPVGSYINIEEEIVRVKKISAGNKLLVLRGVFGTRPTAHNQYSLVTKVKPVPIEFRRPSIIRASGHTFEYLGYGPGNYSTGLPQVQDKTITEREEFLSQSQEREAGIVVYTGMNNKGDFFIGNQKKSSATGEEVTFDTPVPTITGESPSRLSSVFDEVTIKDRLVVEGGASKQILSQFDGPVTFNNSLLIKNPENNKNVKVSSPVTLENIVEISNNTESTTTANGALKVVGGVGIGSTLNADSIISKKVKIGSADNTISVTTGDLKLTADGTEDNVVAIQTNTTITGILSVTDDITAFWSSDERLKDNITPIEDPLAKVVSISGNTFDWNDKSKKRGNDTGLIAQEVEALGLPGLVVTRDNGYLAVDYHKVVPLLVEAIKELSVKVESLEQKLQDK